MQLVPAEKKDIPKIQQLAKKIWQAHYPDIIGQDQINYMLEKFYSSESLEQQMREGQYIFFIVDKGNEVGFIAVSENPKNHYFIHKFYIDNTLHRKGLGTFVFEQLRQQYPNALTYKLQVNRQNFKPINFYFKLGFTIERTADFDIGNGYFMNDFVMAKTM